MCHCWKICSELLIEPVEHEPGREEHEHHRKGDRHDLHDLRLHGIGDRRRRELHLQIRGDRIDDRQHEIRIRRRQILDPQDPRRVPELDRREQHPVERDEHRDLHQDRQAAAQRVDLLLLVHLHHLDLQLLLVVRVLLLQRLQLRPDHLHLRHRARARVVQRIEHALDDDREQHDRPAPVVDDAVQPLQQPEERRRDHREDAVVDDEVEALGEPRELVLLLRPDVERHADLPGRARSDRPDRHDHPGRVEAPVELPRVELPRGLLLVPRQPCRDEVVLHHPHPAVVGILRVRQLAGRIGGQLVELGELDLLELVRLVVDDRPGVGNRGHRIRALHALRLRVARQLEIGKRRDRGGRVVRDVVGDVDQVAAAMEREHLHDLVAVRGDRLQPEFEPVGARRELARARQRREHGAVVRHSLAEQSRLRDGGAFGRPEQRQVGLRLVDRIAMLEEGDLRDGAAGRVDFRAIEIRRDCDDIRGGPARGTRSGRRRAGNRRHRAGRPPPARTPAPEASRLRPARAPGPDATAGGGRDSFCHASHNISAEKEKTTNRMRRWVSMTAWVTARRSSRAGE